MLNSDAPVTLASGTVDLAAASMSPKEHSQEELTNPGQYH